MGDARGIDLLPKQSKTRGIDVTFLILGAIAVLAAFIFYLVRRESIDVNDALRARADGRFVQLTDGMTHYQVAGPADGPVLVFLAGATLSLWIWDGLFEKLAAIGYRVIRFDYFGRGYSDRPQIDYTMQVFHRQLTDLLKVLDVSGPVTLVPLAFGCPIAADLANKSPAVVRSICMIAPDGFGVPLSPLMKLCFKKLIGPPLFQMFGSKALEARLVEYTDDKALIEALRSKYVPELAFKGFKAALTSSLRHVPIHDAKSLYRDLNIGSSAPLLVIWGTADHVTAIPSQAYVNELFSRAKIHFMDGVGHLPHWECLDDTVAIMDGFLKRELAQDKRLSLLSPSANRNRDHSGEACKG